MERFLSFLLGPGMELAKEALRLETGYWARREAPTKVIERNNRNGCQSNEQLKRVGFKRSNACQIQLPPRSCTKYRGHIQRRNGIDWRRVRSVVEFGLSMEGGYLIAFPCGALLGLFAAVWLGFVGFGNYAALTSDLEARVCENLVVNTNRAIEVIINKCPSTIIFDCGDTTLVIVGGWWRNRCRQEVWESQAEMNRFPSTEFTLCRLPKSGRVISVEVKGGRLEVDRDLLPIFEGTGVDSRCESFCINQPVEKLIVDRHDIEDSLTK